MGGEYERYQGVEKHSSGFKLLAAMGWKEGQGLGREGQGRKEHIKVRRRKDSSGIGLAEATKKARDWNTGMVAYDQVLAKLSGLSPAPEESQGNRKRTGGGAADAEAAIKADVDAAGREGTAADTKKTKKKRKGNAERLAGIVAAAASVEEEATAPAVFEQPQSSAKGSHMARYARRRAGKNVRSYSGSDLAAILGEGARSSDAGLPVKKERPSLSQSTLPSLGTASAAEASKEHQNAAQGISDAPDAEAEGPREKRWWHGYFTPAGSLGSIAPPKPPLSAGPTPQVKISGFSEEDQTNLYNMAHDKSGKGRQGLGIASRPKKVAGARWKGRKTIIEDSEGEEGAEEAAKEAAEETVPSDSEARSDDTQIRSEEPASASAAESEENACVDAKSLRRQAVLHVKAAAGSLAMKKLGKRVLDSLGVPRKSAERTAARGMLREAVHASSKFRVEDGLVTLRKA